MLQVFKIVTQRWNAMRGCEIHKRGERGRAKFCRATEGDFSFAEKIESKNLGRFVREVASIELSELDQFGRQFERNGFHVSKLAGGAGGPLPPVFFVS